MTTDAYGSAVAVGRAPLVSGRVSLIPRIHVDPMMKLIETCSYGMIERSLWDVEPNHADGI